MSESKQDFESLVDEALHQPFSGWNFSYLEGRYQEEEPSWDYRKIVRGRMKKAESVLDLGTGGGEFLSTLRPLPEKTFATESYPPNVRVARERLDPLGVKVVETTSDTDLPFEDAFFDLVIDRHESFVAEEVFRILKPGGRFITQQVGERNNQEIRQLFDVRKENGWTLEDGLRELVGAGFKITAAKQESHRGSFCDVGALVYYLKAIPWEVPGFSVEKDQRHLRSIHKLIKTKGRFQVTNHRCLIQAVKPRT